MGKGVCGESSSASCRSLRVFVAVPHPPPPYCRLVLCVRVFREMRSVSGSGAVCMVCVLVRAVCVWCVCPHPGMYIKQPETSPTPTLLIEKSRASCPSGRFPSFIHQVIVIPGLNKL